MNDLINPQGVGTNYKVAEFKKSQHIGWEILNSFADKVEVGMNEKDGRALYADVSKSFGVKKNWHPPKIRFGNNTVRSFSEISSEECRLQDNDIFFIDIGPIINGYEADVGKTFVLRSGLRPDTLGKITLYQKAITDGEEIFALTKQIFYQEKLKGAELYAFAEKQAQNRDWLLVGEGANGHRIGDFPHHVFHRGSLRQFKEQIIPNLWILEIQLRSKDMSFGAFFEDVL